MKKQMNKKELGSSSSNTFRMRQGLDNFRLRLEVLRRAIPSRNKREGRYYRNVGDGVTEPKGDIFQSHRKTGHKSRMIKSARSINRCRKVSPVFFPTTIVPIPLNFAGVDE